MIFLDHRHSKEHNARVDLCAMLKQSRAVSHIRILAFPTSRRRKLFEQLQGAGVEFAMKRSGTKGRTLRISKSLVQSPSRIVIFGFAFLILIGTILLMLPASSKNLPLGFVDALFTSTSAVCVTGLTVVDTGGAFSKFGQFVILVLIQAGGLGTMTLSTLFLLLARRRPSLTGQIVIQDTYTHSRG